MIKGRDSMYRGVGCGVRFGFGYGFSVFVLDCVGCFFVLLFIESFKFLNDL